MLRAWEAGQGRSLTHRALLLLAAAHPDTSWEALEALPIGERDDRMITLRKWTFGSDFSSLAACPVCGERLELHFTAADVRVPETPPEGSLSVQAQGYVVDFRLPNSTDLMRVDGVPDARRQLLRRCVQGARRGTKRRAFSALPPGVLDAVVERMSDADPQANVYTEVSCPHCSHTWQAIFDIVSFFWEELDRWVRRTLLDVHMLASAYGWREADVLALSPWRRQYYLQLVHG